MMFHHEPPFKHESPAANKVETDECSEECKSKHPWQHGELGPSFSGVRRDWSTQERKAFGVPEPSEEEEERRFKEWHRL